jgi:hypothetical protein
MLGRIVCQAVREEVSLFSNLMRVAIPRIPEITPPIKLLTRESAA